MAVDDMVAQVVATLDEEGLLDDTFIFFTSDNGWMQGEHRFPKGKHLPYEEAAQVPLLVRGPGLPSGLVVDRITSNVDVGPTIAAWTGSAPAVPQDGVSLQRYVDDPTFAQDRVIYMQAGPQGGVARWYSGVRTNDWSYVRSSDPTKPWAELYDMVADPWQMNSLHDDPLVADARAWLDSLTDRLEPCAGSACFINEGSAG